MTALLTFAEIALAYAALAIWVARSMRALSARRWSADAAALLALPLIALAAAYASPNEWRLPEIIAVIGGGALCAAYAVRARSRSRDSSGCDCGHGSNCSGPAHRSGEELAIVPRREFKRALIQLTLITSSALFLIPLAWLVVTSLKTDAEMNAYPPVWLPHTLLWRNYPDALRFLPPASHYGLVNVGNTLVIAVMQVIGTVLSSSLVAYGFARVRFPGRDWVFGLVLATMMLPGAVTMMPQFLIFRQLHWIDTLLPLWVPAFFASAFNVFLLRQFFMGIPQELEDAAKIDGCGPLGTWWRVMMPLVRPALAAVSIMTFLSAWKDFMGPLIYISSPEKMPVSYLLQLYNTTFNNEPGLLMAATTLVVLPVIVLFFFTQRYFIEGVTLTGLGGR